jgi:hypothetical protein
MLALFQSSDFWIGYFTGAFGLAAILAVVFLLDW